MEYDEIENRIIKLEEKVTQMIRILEIVKDNQKSFQEILTSQF